MKILIANRGEIARRIIRTARKLGHSTVAAYAEPDSQAPFVAEADEAFLLGPAALAESYLSIERLVAAIEYTGADAVHPGYGFLAENAAFARAVIAAGAIWVGPKPEAIDAMGSKIDARRLATAANVPIIPGYDATQDPAELAAAADKIGYPILVKAAAGGGGKGIRIANEPSQFAAALAEASSEAERSFGDGAMIVERYVQRPRHVEVQIVGDATGAVIHLGTRECSVQRRYQKVLEEAPAPNLEPETRAGLQTAAVELARSIGYDSTGTVEFIVDDTSGDYYFLEMNTRLQVEHPVTEEVTGLDLVELQLAVAGGGPLPIAQSDITFTGHAFEARINAEDPSQNFAPQIGTITGLAIPDGIRWDSGVIEGSEISPHYDSMVAKLIVSGQTREAARRKLAAALDHLVIGGLVTNVGFHRWLIDQAPIQQGRVTTRFLDETDVPAPPPPAFETAATAWRAARRHQRNADHRQATQPWHRLGSFRLTPHRPTNPVGIATADGVTTESATNEAKPNPINTAALATAVVNTAQRTITLNVEGHSQSFTAPSRSERWAPDDADAASGRAAGAITAPFPAAVTEVNVEPGQTVAGGDPVVVIEAMKMLHTLAAKTSGVVDEVRVAPGDQVASNQVLVTFESGQEEQA